MKRNHANQKPINRPTFRQMRLLDWLTNLELSGGSGGEAADLAPGAKSGSIVLQVLKHELTKFQTIKFTTMKTKNRMLKWMAILILLMAGINGAWAQGPYPDDATTQYVCLSDPNQPYGVIDVPTSTFKWTINDLTVSSDWTITSTGHNTISVLWKTSGTYTVQVLETTADNCAQPNPVEVTVIVTDLPTATISYTGSPWCSTETSETVSLTGTGAYTGGVYSSTAGLTINASTGEINPSTSTPGTYTVTYTTVAGAGCGTVDATTSVTITDLPTATISYTGSPWCSTETSETVTLTGTGAYTGGVYSSTAGLTINASTGEINPSTSTPGTYTVTYTTVAGAGCGTVDATTSVTITDLPTATISYTGSPWCSTETSETVTLTGTGAYTGGVYSSTAGLTINASTGEINPSTSTPGTYTVTYTTVAGAGCGTVTTTTSVTITALPTATISYTGSPWCTDDISEAVTLTGTGAYTGGVYSSTAGLTINASTGEINPSTSTPGTYTVTYTTVAGAGCGIVTTTTSVIISPLPVTSPIYHN